MSPCLGIFLLKAAASGPAHVQLFLGLQQAVYWGFEVWQSRYSRHSWNALAHTLTPLCRLHLELKTEMWLCHSNFTVPGIGYQKNPDETEHCGFNLNHLMPKIFTDNLLATGQAKIWGDLPFGSVKNQDFFLKFNNLSSF